MTHQFQPLAFAAGEGVDRLAEAQVAEADFLQEFQARFGAASGGEVGEAGEELQGVIDGGFEEVGDAPVPGGEVLSAQWGRGGRGLNTGHWALSTEHFPRPLTAEFHFQNMLAIAPPVAVRAADALGLTKSAAGMRYLRAMRRLRVLLDDNTAHASELQPNTRCEKI